MSKDKKGLGMGLDILFGADDFDDPEAELLTLPIEKVEPNKEQPREYFDEKALQDLADSISQYGLIQPVVARKLETGYYQIIAGERRWRASRIAGLKEIPVRIIEADDRRTAELALVENLQREDLNPIEEAKGYKSLIDEYGLTQEETAKSVGRSRPAITNSLRLLSLSPEVLTLVEIGELSAGHARALIPINDSEKQLNAAQEVIKKGLSVRKTEKLAANIIKDKPSKEDNSGEITVDYAAEISQELTSAIGRKVKLTEGKQNGKIEITYCGADDREALINAIRNLKI